MRSNGDVPQQKAGGRWLTVLFLQAVVAVYAAASVAAKFASGHAFLSQGFFVCYGAELLLLGFYALLWQQVVKHLSLTTAYANRSVAVFWGLLFSAVVFGERITVQNLLGVAVIFVGVLLVNTEKEEPA